jgi:hypothetical protein
MAVGYGYETRYTPLDHQTSRKSKLFVTNICMRDPKAPVRQYSLSKFEFGIAASTLPGDTMGTSYAILTSVTFNHIHEKTSKS